MEEPSQHNVVATLVALSARVDALTWIAAALMRSHQDPRAVLAAWTDRLPDAADSGFEIDAPAYRQRYQKELQLWTEALRAEVQRRG